MKKENINKIFTIFKKNNPEPKTELEYINDYTLLVAIILSAQATDISVNKATKELFKTIQSPQDMLSITEEELKSYIKTIGLYNSKARNIFGMSKIILAEHDGKIPLDLEKLQQLPGVGRKTANVFLNCAYNLPTIGVDTHVFRVANRIGLTKSKNPLDTEKQLHKNIDDMWKIHAHHWLILHGRYICKARKPECQKCPISQFCEFYQKQPNLEPSHF